MIIRSFVLLIRFLDTNTLVADNHCSEMCSDVRVREMRADGAQASSKPASSKLSRELRASLRV